MEKTGNKSIYRNRFTRLAAICLAVILAVSYLPAKSAYAAGDSKSKTKTTETKTKALDSEKSIREVHKVKAGKKQYCFFVTHNVVLTPAEIEAFEGDDEKLTDEVLKRAGLYMKEENCKQADHKAISPADWKKKLGTLSLGKVEIYQEQEEDEAADASDADDTADAADAEGSGEDTADGDTPGDGDPGDAGDTGDAGETGDANEEEAAAETTGGELVKVDAVEALRLAAPSDGKPVRIEADIIFTTEKAKKGSDKEPKKYSTFKKKSPNSPKLIYIAVATEKDAKLGEEICEAQKPKKSKTKDSASSDKDVEDPEEQLPEFRSISMTDRSGGPLEPTLKEGDPVTLEWIEPGKQTDSNDDQKGFFDHAWAIPAMIGAAAILAAALVLILRRRKDSTEEQ